MYSGVRWLEGLILLNQMAAFVLSSFYFVFFRLCLFGVNYFDVFHLSNISLLKTKRSLLYLKTQFVPRSKHFSSPLQKPISLCCKWHRSLFVLR